MFCHQQSRPSGAKQLQTELAAMLNTSPLTPDTWRPPIVSIGNLYEPADFCRKDGGTHAKNIGSSRTLLISGQLALRMERKALMEINDALRAAFWNLS